jgi:EF-P beta-lysylation protein EpmB
MEKGNLDDPLLRQVLPIAEELETTEGFSTDPVGDLAASIQPGLLHKYHGRALLITTGACAINCRFCFRRHFPYAESGGLETRWHEIIKQLGHTPDIQEVILSGGDPLMLSDDRLSAFIQSLEAIPHVKRLRIHSRLPIVLPERVCDSLLQWLSETRLQTVIVVHCNHPNELGTQAQEALGRLRETNITLLNQSVLLRGVNDSPAVLMKLSESLFDNGVLPYYLHLLDRVQGAAHFDVAPKVIQKLEQMLRTQLPGYLVPRLVREEATAPAKTPIFLDTCTATV